METNKGNNRHFKCPEVLFSDIRSGDSVPTLVPIEKLLTSNINQINSISNTEKKRHFQQIHFVSFFSCGDSQTLSGANV